MARGIPGSCHHSQSPSIVSVDSRETCFPSTASTFKPRMDSHHGGTWDSPVGKPRGKARDPLINAKRSVTLLLQLGAWSWTNDLTCLSFIFSKQREIAGVFSYQENDEIYVKVLGQCLKYNRYMINIHFHISSCPPASSKMKKWNKIQSVPQFKSCSSILKSLHVAPCSTRVKP